MTKLKIPVAPADHAQGPAVAPVTLVEYGDYQCPHCGHAYPIVKRLQRQFGEDLRFVFRNFPLVNAHPYAELAAEAAESADSQGSFWEMHDYVYENQDELSPEMLLAGAEALRLDRDRFRDDLDAHRFLDRIKKDFSGGVRSGVNGTPTFFINGARHDADFEFQTLSSAIRSALSKAA